MDPSSSLTPWRYALPLIIVILGYRAHFLNVSGSLSACLVGCLVIEAGWSVAGMLITFFLLGSIATKVKQKEKEAAMPYPETEEEAIKREQAANGKKKTEPQSKAHRKGRDMYQVFATGLIPALICFGRHLFPSITSNELISTNSSSSSFVVVHDYWYLTYLAYVACCCGDTLASEIGMLAKQTPIMLLQKKKVPTGVDGGMTFLGTFASVVGGCLIGAFGGTLFDIYVGGIYGCIGAFLDSILGTLMQSTQYLEANGTTKTTSNKDQATGFVDATQIAQTKPLPLTPASWKQLNNLVNVLSSLLSSLIAIGVQYLFIHYSIDLLPSLTFLSILLLFTLIPDASARISWVAIVIGSILFFQLFPTTTHPSLLITLTAYSIWRIWL